MAKERRKSILELSKRIDTMVDGMEKLTKQVGDLTTEVGKNGTTLKELDPVLKALNTVYNMKNFGVFWAGLITPWAIVVGAIYAGLSYFK